MGVLSIGIDYFQVLSILANSNQIEWPDQIKSLYRVFSVFNLNLDLLAPECSMPSMGYEDKWAAIISLPIIAFSVFLASHFMKWGHKKFVLKRSKKLHNHRHLVIGSSEGGQAVEEIIDAFDIRFVGGRHIVACLKIRWAVMIGNDVESMVFF